MINEGDVKIKKIFECMSEKIILSGHSFGGATMLDMFYRMVNSESIINKNNSKKLLTMINKLILLDPWINSLEKTVTTYNYKLNLNKNKEHDVKIDILMSEEFWTSEKNGSRLKSELIPSTSCSVHVLKGSMHQFIADTSIAIP